MLQTKLSKPYIILEGILLVALLVFQSILIHQGHPIGDKSSDLWVYIAAIKVALTAVSLIMVVIAFLIRGDKKLSSLDLLILYFSFTVTADIFFSFTTISWAAHLCFACAYLLFIYIRDGKWYEAFIPLAVGAAIFFALYYGLKMDALMAALDAILGSALIFNLVMCWIKFGKTKEKRYLWFAIGLSCIFVSDLSIVFYAKIANPMALSQAIGMINWPFYVVGNVFIVLNYMCEKEQIE